MFDAVPAPAPHALHQDPALAAALRLCGQTPVILDSGHLLLSQQFFGLRCLMLARATPSDDLIAQLTQRGLHRIPLLLSPERPCSLPRAVQLAGPRMLLQLDLHPSAQTQRAVLHQKWRNQLRRSEETPFLRVSEQPLEGTHPVLALDAAQSKARRYRSWPVGLTTAFAQIAPAQTHVFTAYLKGHPVAYMVFLSHGDGATYHIGHTTPAGRRAQAHNLLLWQAMRRLRAKGFVRLDLGPATTPDIDRFKRRAGAQAHQTGGTWLRWTPLARKHRTC